MHGPDGEGGVSHMTPFVLDLLASYGWIVASIILLAFLLRNKISDFFRGVSASPPVNPEEDEELLRKQREQQDAARRRMQEEYDQVARVHAEKVKKEEAEKLARRIEELDGKAHSKGHRLGTSADQSTSSSTNRKPTGPRIREDNYSPLMGAGGVGGFRSSRNCGPKGG